MRVVDLFAGAGGFSQGAREAGAQVLLAANHWPLAVRYHRENHPETKHLVQDLHQADFTRFPDHDLLTASPSCIGHTRARGKEKRGHDNARATAWAVVSCAEAKRPPYFVVENVPEFLRWELYPAWEHALFLLGYDLETRRIKAGDLGLPQIRERVFIVGGRRGSPKISLDPLPPTAVRPFIEWGSGTWRAIEGRSRPLVEATLRQIDHGRKAYGDRFAIAYYGEQRRRGTSRSLDLPLGSLTTKDRYALVDGDRMRMLSISEAVSVMGFPRNYSLPPNRVEAMKMLGNAVSPPVGAFVISQIMKEVS